ncbi:MAG: cysteine--tRNA ligase [Candidatus Gracilibacteria bacterium]|nr:cysteine--tRNA ligase [Candidatus Gracilibacteria bacterium]
MLINNTKTRKIEEFKPLSSREVKVYYCGPTVYNYAHIGNLRTFVFEDIVVRTLRFLGYNVKTVMNITDVDDKTIRDSISAGEDLIFFTQKYTKIFIEDIKKLNIIPADEIVPVTTLIPEMVRMIQTMLNRRHAYLGEDGSIYFDVKTFKKYGNLAGIDMCNCGLQHGARVNSDEYDKENVADFVLWKAWKESDGVNFWNEKFTIKGEEVVLKGRPGWHIECSACNMKYFGAQIDIHMGGVDLIFPHHQNEIAQSESCTRKEFSKYWLHSGHLMVDGKKMAKSANNFYRLKDLEEKFSSINPSVLYRAIRLSFMNAKYNSEVNFTFDKIESNITVINSIDELIKKINREIENTDNNAMVSRDFRETMQDYIHEYMYHLEDDFNIPECLAVMHNFIKFLNTGIREKLFSVSELNSALDMFRTFNQVLGIIDFDVVISQEIPLEILAKLEARNNSKKDKNFELADKLRDELILLGYKIVDTRDRSFLEKI